MLRKSNYNYTITTRSTYIKPISEFEISQNYISWLNDFETNKFLETRHTKQTKEKVVDYINYLRKIKNCDMFAIFDNETNKHIGNLTITSFNSNNNGSATFGVMIGDKMSKSIGIGAEVIISFIEFLFTYGPIERVSAGAASKNFKSCNTLESIGLVREGIIRNIFPLSNGEKCDHVLYGLLKEEWNIKRKKFKIFLNSTKFLSN